MGSIYKVTSKIDGRIYIGLTIQTIQARFVDHSLSAKREKRLGKTSTYFYNALLKYGKDNFIVEEIVNVNNDDLLYRLEKMYIKKFKATNKEFGFNILEGGQGAKPTDEMKKKMSEISIQKYKDHPELKEKIANTLRGRKLSEEHKRNISKGGTGKKMSKEQREKMSIIAKKRIKNGVPMPSRKGVKLTEGERRIISERTKEAMKNPEVRKKISGENNGMKKHGHTEEVKVKISKSLMGNKYAEGMKHTDEWKEKHSEFLRGNKYAAKIED